jgi:very-short-patch-repair endonuclease
MHSELAQSTLGTGDTATATAATATATATAGQEIACLCNFIEEYKQKTLTDLVFYDCGFMHKNIANSLAEDVEFFLLVNIDLQKNFTPTDFAVSLDDAWVFLGFSQKARAKSLLEKHFILNTHYKIMPSIHDISCKCKGCNKDIILMTLETFNLLCLKGDTKLCHKIQEYYIKLEQVAIKTIDDEYKHFTTNTNVEFFTKSLDDLIPILNSQKVKIVHHLKKNYKEHYHYIIDNNNGSISSDSRGGQNKITYMLTDYTFELIKNSYNMRNRYIADISDNIKCVNISMSIETQTIGFIANSFCDVVVCKRQHAFAQYKVDLYFPEQNLVIECDENNHDDRDIHEEKTREEYILSLGKTMIRFNPNHNKFDLSFVLREINRVIFSKNDVSIKLIKLP